MVIESFFAVFSKFQNKRGIIHLAIIPIVLVISLIIVFAVIKVSEKSGAVGAPTGTIQATPSTVFGYGNIDASIKLTAKNVQGANGAQVDRVTYYLVNPNPGPLGWSGPDWCSNYLSDGRCDMSGYYTWNISESSNPNNNYEIIWDKNTLSSGSTQVPRALAPVSILPGTYTIGLKVEDVNGNVTGSASSIKVTLSQSQTPPPVVSSPSPNPFTRLGLKFSVSSIDIKLAQGEKVNNVMTITSTGATEYDIYTPTNSGGIRWDSPASGGKILPGQSITKGIQADPGQAPGVYTGQIYAATKESNWEMIATGIPTKITLTSPSASPASSPSPIACLTAPTEITALNTPTSGSTINTNQVALSWFALGADSWGKTCGTINKHYKVYMDKNSTPTTLVGAQQETAMKPVENKGWALRVQGVAELVKAKIANIIPPVFAGNTTAPYTPPKKTYATTVNNLQFGTRYYWRVEACNGEACTSSTTYYFNVQ